MSKLEELLKRECPDGVEYKTLEDVCNIYTGEQLNRKNMIKEGYPVINGGIQASGYTNNFNEYEETITISQGGASAGFVNFMLEKFWAGAHCYIIKPSTDKLINKYLFFVLKNIEIYIMELKSGAGIPGINKNKITKIKIPIPPIEVQEEIVRILDTFTKYQDLLNRELELRKKQYEYYRDKLLTFGDEVEYKTVGDVGLVTKLAGFEFTKYVTYSNKGKIIALRGLNVKNGRLNLDEVKYIDESDLTKLTRSKLYIDDMLFTYVGTIGEVALIDENDKYYLAPNVALIRFDKKLILPKFMIYYFQSKIFFNTQINKLLQSSSMKNIPMEKIRKFLVPIPPLEEQERIVKILDQFDTLCNDITKGLPAEIEMRKKQYEYYRDKLLTFKEKKK
ncbi:restriction endonuclease subunit S [Brachyspira pilosicoli]|uniref:restriction endonuclease subunit S n=1 Tax=Brachyspira pilosicoli TaxID=52584 RepID=UPI003005ADB9